MDYTKSSFLFKLKKAYRYLLLYGFSRTLIKIKGQYHMNKTFTALPNRPADFHCLKPVIALVGCGNFAYSNIAYYLTRYFDSADIVCMDCNIDRAASLYSDYRLLSYTDVFSDIVFNESIELVYIASNHASHASYAVKCLDAGKHVHIEKPHVVTDGDLDSLLSAMLRNPNSCVFLGFNRPKSSLFKLLLRYLSRESGPLMINWFIAGHEIPDNHWYFKEEEGGRILGNLCHWTDLTLMLVGLENAFPCQIIPATPHGSKSDFMVSLNFNDGSCASFTFSAKGHTFEGVREVLNVHRGNLLGSLSDFHELSLDIGDRKFVKKLRHRDHGHKANIINSSEVLSGRQAGVTLDYVRATAMLFLGIRKAVESGETLFLTV